MLLVSRVMLASVVGGAGARSSAFAFFGGGAVECPGTPVVHAAPSSATMARQAAVLVGGFMRR